MVGGLETLEKTSFLEISITSLPRFRDISNLFKTKKAGDFGVVFVDSRELKGLILYNHNLKLLLNCNYKFRYFLKHK